jgi:hypothetical protein
MDQAEIITATLGRVALCRCLKRSLPGRESLFLPGKLLLEVQLDCELHQTRVIYSLRDLSEC